jgi:hypothetical protein
MLIISIMNMEEIGSILRSMKASLIILINMMLTIFFMRVMREIMIQKVKQKNQRYMITFQGRTMLIQNFYKGMII